MRILHIHSGNLFGGVETLLATIGRHSSGTHRFALCFEGRLSRELREAGVPLSMLGEVRASRPWTVWRARRRLAAALAEGGVDVCICHAAWPLAVFGSTARRAGTPLALWQHDVATGRHWVERWASWTRPDYAICNSRFTQSALAELFPALPSSVVYCPAGPPKAIVADAARAEARAELGVGPETVVIIQVSRLESWKGHELHLRALARLADRPDWVCWIAGGPQKTGEDEYQRRLEALAAETGIAGRVRFLGQRSDVPRLMAGADVFCQPNTGPEPFGLVFVEALAAGIPAVTTRMGGAVEIVDDSCGVLTPPGDAAALADALGRLISDREWRRRLGAAGPERARTLCDPAARIRELEAVLTPLMASANVGAKR
jgi:glycosyltransferase involved in cell wall biosynthesis